MEPTNRTQLSSIFESAAFYIISILVFILPILFLPWPSAPFVFTKSAALAIGTLLALIAFIAYQFKERRIEMPYGSVFLALWSIPLVYGITTVFSKNTATSFLGQNLGIDTFGFILFGSIVTTILVSVVRVPSRVLSLYRVLFSVTVLLLLFYLVRIFAGSGVLSFGIFQNVTNGPIGSWNDLGVFLGLVVVVSLIALVSRMVKDTAATAVYVVVGVSMFLLMLVNFSTVWWIVGLFALAVFVSSVIAAGSHNEDRASEQEMMTEQEPRMGGISFAALGVLAIVLVFVLFGSGLGTYLADAFNINFIDVRPSWQSTVDIGKATYEESPIFGSGPNTFEKQWLLYKPVEVNSTIFWNTRFVSGIGFIPTSLITNGLLGVIAWVLFFAAFLYAGFRSLVLRPVGDRVIFFISLSSFVAALYLWIITVVYTPGIALMAFAFIFTGIFIGSLRYNKGVLPRFEISFIDNPRLGFVAVLVLTVVFLGSVAGIFSVGSRYVAAHSIQAGRAALNAGDIASASRYANRALALNENDAHYRLATDVTLAELTRLLSETQTPDGGFRSQFELLVGRGIQNAREATIIDSTNDRNWLTLARVYELISPLNIEGSYENAVRAIDEALLYNPQSPSILLERARLELTLNNTERGKQYIEQALAKKNNYTDASFLLAQVQISQGNITEAIRSVESAIVLTPNNPVAFFQLGILYYSNNNIPAAVAALERAVSLDNRYSNARYFLGLSYYRQDRIEDAIRQFEIIASLNRDNTEVPQIIENLKAGNAPIPSLRRAVTELEELPIDSEE